MRTGGVFPGELQCRWASRLFWCIYVLDRKWSFGTGLPFAIQDSDMDTNLPEPGAVTPYLTCMISYARLSTKIWGLVVGWPLRARSTTTDHCSYLDFQVQQWIQSIPQELRFDPSGLCNHNAADGAGAAVHSSDSMVMLQVLLALQANQLRILVYRQNLFSHESIETDVTGASIAVETAKSTVHMLDLFSRVSELYFQRPEPFNYFLLSALAALFLAVLHAPARFSQVCRPEFYSAVDMVRRSSTRARTSRRLQKVIRSLKLIPLGRNQGETHAAGSAPFSHKTSSGPVANQTESTSTTTLPGTSTDMVQSMSSPSGFHEINTCEDLTSFLELAGGVYFDQQIAATSDLTGDGKQDSPDVDDPRLPAGGYDILHGEDEALTKILAGLL